MHCPSCEADNPAGARFCEQCGCAIELRCSHCGAVARPRARFCVSCGQSLQTIGISKGYYLFYAAPYVLTLVMMILTVTPDRSLRGMPGELSLVR